MINAKIHSNFHLLLHTIWLKHAKMLPSIWQCGKGLMFQEEVDTEVCSLWASGKWGQLQGSELQLMSFQEGQDVWNICLLPNFTYWSLVLRGCIRWRGLGGWLGYEDSTIVTGISAFTKERRGAHPPSYHMRTQESAICEGQSLIRQWIHCRLSVGLSGFQNCTQYMCVIQQLLGLR